MVQLYFLGISITKTSQQQAVITIYRKKSYISFKELYSVIAEMVIKHLVKKYRKHSISTVVRTRYSLQACKFLKIKNIIPMHSPY
jgi:hypothetical protein